MLLAIPIVARSSIVFCRESLYRLIFFNKDIVKAYGCYVMEYMLFIVVWNDSLVLVLLKISISCRQYFAWKRLQTSQQWFSNFWREWMRTTRVTSWLEIDLGSSCRKFELTIEGKISNRKWFKGKMNLIRVVEGSSRLSGVTVRLLYLWDIVHTVPEKANEFKQTHLHDKEN